SLRCRRALLSFLHDALPILIARTERKRRLEAGVFVSAIQRCKTWRQSAAARRYRARAATAIDGDEDEHRLGHLAPFVGQRIVARSEEHTSELQSRENLVCRL